MAKLAESTEMCIRNVHVLHNWSFALANPHKLLRSQQKLYECSDQWYIQLRGLSVSVILRSSRCLDDVVLLIALVSNRSLVVLAKFSTTQLLSAKGYSPIQSSVAKLALPGGALGGLRKHREYMVSIGGLRAMTFVLGYWNELSWGKYSN